MPSVAAVARSGEELARVFATPLTAIGTITTEGLTTIDDRGRTYPLESSGWDHFA